VDRAPLVLGEEDAVAVRLVHEGEEPADEPHVPLEERLDPRPRCAAILLWSSGDTQT